MLFFLVAAALSDGCAGCNSREAMIVKKIEKNIVLPRGAAPLKNYVRRYAWLPQGEYDIAVVYEMEMEDKHYRWSDSYWGEVDELPIVMHGGCSVLMFFYNSVTDKVSGLGRNCKI